MGAARDFKFGVRIHRWPTDQTIQKQVKRGVGYVAWPTFIILGPFISLERTELETSNFVCGLTVQPSNQKMQN